MKYLLLILLWTLWCVLHSLLISKTANRIIERIPERISAYYRMFYNIFALVSFGYLILYSKDFQHLLLFEWQGFWQIGRIIMIMCAGFLFLAGAKNYNKAQFLGISQILNKKSGKGISKDGNLNTSGILSWTRHPWYLATILIIWSYSDVIYLSSLIVNIILTTYVIIGMLLEERKLVMEFGDRYRTYQKDVPILIPYKRPTYH